MSGHCGLASGDLAVGRASLQRVRSGRHQPGMTRPLGRVGDLLGRPAGALQKSEAGTSRQDCPGWLAAVGYAAPGPYPPRVPSLPQRQTDGQEGVVAGTGQRRSQQAVDDVLAQVHQHALAKEQRGLVAIVVGRRQRVRDVATGEVSGDQRELAQVGVQGVEASACL